MNIFNLKPRMPHIAITPERLWTWLVVLAVTLLLLLLVHAGWVFLHYGVGWEDNVPEASPRAIQLNTKGLESIVSGLAQTESVATTTPEDASGAEE